MCYNVNYIRGDIIEVMDVVAFGAFDSLSFCMDRTYCFWKKQARGVDETHMGKGLWLGNAKRYYNKKDWMVKWKF